MSNLAVGYLATGNFDRALPLFEETFTLTKAKLGPAHPDTLTYMNNLAKAYKGAGKLLRAQPLFEDALALVKAKLGPDHPDTLTSMNNLALCYQSAGKPDRALPLRRELANVWKRIRGRDSLQYGAALDRLIELAEMAGTAEDARLWKDEKPKLVGASTPKPDAK